MITQVALARYHEQDCLISEHREHFSYLALKRFGKVIVMINSNQLIMCLPRAAIISL